jgi:hypothetical protein
MHTARTSGARAIARSTTTELRISRSMLRANARTQYNAASNARQLLAGSA